MASIGIDDIAIHFPKLYFDMKDFAEFRGANFDKLEKGLGLKAMAIPDAHEDTATMGANACIRLIERNQLDPRKIGRIYLGTESALDGSKPTATYIIDMLVQRYQDQYGSDCFRNCDVVDLTFACIGAVDAMHNTLDWVARGGEDEDRIGIVVFSDNAKYDLESSGEYTQGAGGGALLIRHSPRLMAIPDRWGISTMPVHDFFKPRREMDIRTVVERVLDLAKENGESFQADIVDKIIAGLPTSSVKDKTMFEEPTLKIHKDTPVFDGQFSNKCYSEAVKSAFIDFKSKAIRDGRYSPPEDPVLTEQWGRIIVHLPYAFQGKRMFPDVFRHDRQHLSRWQEIVDSIGPEPSESDFESSEDGRHQYERAAEQYRRKISKTQAYRDFVEEKIEKTQRASSLIGNQYTGSIFLALMSTLEADLQDDEEMEGTQFGLCGYGSGAKAKVFEGVIQPRWREVVARFNLFERLSSRKSIDKSEYLALHTGRQKQSIIAPHEEFALVAVGGSGKLEGQRGYTWIG